MRHLLEDASAACRDPSPAPRRQSLGQFIIIENVSGADGTRLTQTDIR